MVLQFDKIYCLHLANNKDRYNHIINEFKKIGIENKINFWWTCKKEISNKIGNYLTELHDRYYDDKIKNNPNVYGNVYNCVLEHYNIIKTSYDRGFNDILILEDDIKFIDDIKLIEYTFNNIPRDYCCCKFYCTQHLNIYNEKLKTNKYQEFTKENFPGKALSTAMYCLDRNGMLCYINAFNKCIKAADLIFEDFINEIYVVKKPLCWINSNLPSCIL